MDNRRILVAALEGDCPERIPLTINEEFVSDDPAWQGLFEQGLCLIPYVGTVSERWSNEAAIERITTHEPWEGQPAERIILRTPRGVISQVR